MVTQSETIHYRAEVPPGCGCGHGRQPFLLILAIPSVNSLYIVRVEAQMTETENVLETGPSVSCVTLRSTTNCPCDHETRRHFPRRYL